MKKQSKNKPDNKTTSEKPVSIPLDFEETLRDLLTIPPSKEPKEKERKSAKRQKKKPN